MKQIEIKVTIDGNDPTQVNAAIALLQSLNSDAETEKPAPRTRKRKVADKPAEAKTEEDPASKEKEITITDVRTLLAKKVEIDREAIKAKLTELGANNVTSLDSTKYPEFIEFLNSL